MAVRKMNWAQSIQIATQSGMSQKEWCAANWVSRSSFYRWKRILKEQLLNISEPEQNYSVSFAKLEQPTETIRRGNSSQVILLRTKSLTVELPMDSSEEEVLRAVRHAR